MATERATEHATEHAGPLDWTRGLEGPGVILVTKEGLEVRATAEPLKKKSIVISDMTGGEFADDGDDESRIVLSKITYECLAEFVEYAYLHRDLDFPLVKTMVAENPSPDPDAERPTFEEVRTRHDRGLGQNACDRYADVAAFPHPLIRQLIQAADFLADEWWTALLAQELVRRIRGKVPAEIAEILGEPDDLTDEERREISEKNEWTNDA